MQRRNTARKKGATAVCGEPLRQDVDIGVKRHVSACNDLLNECAHWLQNARGNDAASEAQRTLLLNLAGCMAQAVYGMFVLLNHGAVGAVLILERSTIEYYGRASYYMGQPDHALWTVEVEQLQGVIDNEKISDQRRVELVRAINAARRRRPQLTPEGRTAAGLPPFHQVKILDMIRIGLGEEAARRYGAASLVLHGDLYSSRLIGSRGAEAMNGALLEAASGLIAFCNQMLSWLPRPPEGLVERVQAAEDETARLAKRYGRAYLISDG